MSDFTEAYKKIELIYQSGNSTYWSIINNLCFGELDKLTWKEWLRLFNDAIEETEKEGDLKINDLQNKLIEYYNFEKVITRILQKAIK